MNNTFEYDNYQKTILRLANIFREHGYYSLRDADEEKIAELINIDVCILHRALTEQDDNTDKYSYAVSNDYGDNDCTFIDVIYRYVCIRTDMQQVDYSTDNDSLNKNIELFMSALHNFDMINAKLATYECMCDGQFSHKYAAYYDSTFTPKQTIEFLRTMQSCYGTDLLRNKKILPIIYRNLRYEFITRTNVLYLIAVVQVIKHSSFFTQSLHNMANELYYHLLFLFQNARVILIQANTLLPSVKIPECDRGRKDNTTRLQIIYGYDNFDAYGLRLDLAHKGQGFFHYNNTTPGGVKCCLFNKSEHSEIIEKHPELNDCFIEYGDRYGIKESVNISINNEVQRILNDVRKDKEHDKVFEDTYSEESIVAFITVISYMLPSECRVPIDKDGLYQKYAFNYDYIMRDMCFLYLAFMIGKEDDVTTMIKIIVDTALRYHIINDNEAHEYETLDGILMIADLAEERMTRFAKE